MRTLLSLALWPLRTLGRRVTGYLDAALAVELSRWTPYDAEFARDHHIDLEGVSR